MEAFVRAVDAAGVGSDARLEVVFMDDGSTDGTLEIVRALAARDPRVRYVSFSRNFGKEAALLAGLRKATGALVATLDADLQDPPALLPEMLRAIREEGYDCVATRRTSREGEPPVRSWFARRFYWLMRHFSDVALVDGARDYRMMTRRVVEAILALPEVNRFTKGIYQWVGFRTKWLAFPNVARAAGARAGETLGAGIGGMLVAAAKGWAGLALCVWPAVLAFGVMWVAWRNRRGLWAMVLRAPEWWCYLVAAAGLFSLSCGNGCIRLGMPFALAGVIVALRERRAFGTLGPRMRWGFVAMALAWMLCVTGWQTVLGLNNLRMLRVYRHDPQGVTVFAALPTGPFHYATCHGTYNKFHWMLFRRESGLAHDPIALTPWLYATLYHAPADFFAMAREVRPGIFVAPRAPRLAVLRGERPPEALCTAAQAWLAASSPQASGWRRFVPGRFRVMFPPEDFQLYIPGNHATITAADGQAYTLVTAPKPKP